MEAIKGGQKAIDSLFVRPRQWQLTAFRKNEIVSDWIGERSQSSKFAGGAIWCHLASPKPLGGYQNRRWKALSGEGPRT